VKAKLLVIALAIVVLGLAVGLPTVLKNDNTGTNTGRTGNMTPSPVVSMPTPTPTPKPIPTPIPWVENCESLFTPEERDCLARDNCTLWQLSEMMSKLTILCVDYTEVFDKLMDAEIRAIERLGEQEESSCDCCVEPGGLLRCPWRDSWGFLHCPTCSGYEPFYPEPDFPEPP
jgi:hypothetical protein